MGNKPVHEDGKSFLLFPNDVRPYCYKIEKAQYPKEFPPQLTDFITPVLLRKEAKPGRHYLVACYLNVSPLCIKVMDAWTGEVYKDIDIEVIMTGKYAGKIPNKETHPDHWNEWAAKSTHENWFHAQKYTDQASIYQKKQRERSYSGWIEYDWGFEHNRITVIIPPEMEEQINQAIQKIFIPALISRVEVINRESQLKVDEKYAILQEERNVKEKERLSNLKEREQLELQFQKEKKIAHIRNHKVAPSCGTCGSPGGNKGKIWMCNSCTKKLCMACWVKEKGFLPDNRLICNMETDGYYFCEGNCEEDLE